MQLPRYIKARSAVSELQSAANSTITPAEAANLQMAKYGAIAAGAKGLSEISAGIAEIQAEEEYASSVAQFEASIGSIDTALAQKPFETDDEGRLVSDTKNIFNQERAARKQLASDIRSTMKSGLAKKEFDRFMMEEGIRRDSSYQAKMIEREAAVLTARLNTDVNMLLDTGNYDGARERLDQAVGNGAIDPLNYTKSLREVDTREVTDQIFEVLNAPLDRISPEMVDTMLTRMESEEFDLLSADQKYTYINRLNAKLSDLGGDIEDQLAQEQRQIYRGLLVKDARGELDLPTLLNSGLTDKTYFKDLLTQVRGDEGADTTNPAIKAAFDASINRLKSSGYAGDDWGQAVSDLRDSVLGEATELSQEDRDKLEKKLNDMESGIYSTELYRNLSRQAFENIVGFDEGLLAEVTSGLQAQYKVTADVGREFQQALMRKAETLGPRRQDELDKWVENAKVGYRLLAGRKNLEKIGVNVDLPEDGVLTEELRLDISNQIQKWFTASANKPGADMQALEQRAMTTIAEIERLYDWTLDEPQ